MTRGSGPGGAVSCPIPVRTVALLVLGSWCVQVAMAADADIAFSLSRTYEGQEGERLGEFLAAGDVDGDGHADLLVPEYYYESAPGSESGGVRVCHGSDEGLRDPCEVIPGAPGDRLGGPIASSDLDGDGFHDMVVVGYPEPTQIFVQYGSPLGLSLARQAIPGTGSERYFGEFLDAKGDITGDGFRDLVAVTVEDAITGWAQVRLGGPTGLQVEPCAVVPLGHDEGSPFMYTSVALAGDLDGDGFDDLVTGQAWSSPGGYVSVYPGASTCVSETAEVVLTRYDSKFGESVAAAGDMNGDGYEDIAVGDTVIEVENRYTVVFYGDVGGPAEDRYTEIIFRDPGEFGKAIAAADLDADGFSDLVVSDWHGRVYVVRGSPEGADTDYDLVEPEMSELSYFGSVLVPMGDVDADGLYDLAVSDTYYKNSAGRVYVYLNATATDRKVDGDGDGATSDVDCDDTNPAIHPGAAEDTCNDRDDDCDGDRDEDAPGALTWYRDADGDGFGDPSAPMTGCEPPSGYVADATDCDDSLNTRHPGANELVGDGIDQDCDGEDAEDTGAEEGKGICGCGSGIGRNVAPGFALVAWVLLFLARFSARPVSGRR